MCARFSVGQDRHSQWGLRGDCDLQKLQSHYSAVALVGHEPAKVYVTEPFYIEWACILH